MRFGRDLFDDLRRANLELGSPGTSELSGRSLARAQQFMVTLVVVLTNLIGSCAVLVLAYVVVPLPAAPHPAHVRLVNAVVGAIYLAVAVPVGTLLGTRGLRQLRRWLIEERPATAREPRIVLRAPLRLFVVQVALWFGAAAVFGALNAVYSGELGVWVAVIIAITGMTTASCAYLLTERLFRPAAVRALSQTAPERLAVPGVATRALLAWALGTGLSLLGLVVIGVSTLAGDPATRSQLAVAMVVLGCVGIAVGLLTVMLAARATADPVDSVRRALSRVQRGEFDIQVPVYDGTQVGQLQLGFNRMVAGLAERERIREVFGTYVDPEVANRILAQGTSLEGEEVEVTIMFIDIRDFTGFAERTPAREVVGSINRLFECIVPIIHDHGGLVDKFLGDGLLAVFGAPRRQADHADRALATAIDVEHAVSSDQPDGFEIGIGLDSGLVVAGNVGAGGRLQFTVIGDSVNVAARAQAATRETGDTILLTERTRALLNGSRTPLTVRPDVQLKGKHETVPLYAYEPRSDQSRIHLT